MQCYLKFIEIHNITKYTRRKIFFKYYQTIWKRMINSEATYYFLIIQHLLGFIL